MPSADSSGIEIKASTLCLVLILIFGAASVFTIRRDSNARQQERLADIQATIRAWDERDKKKLQQERLTAAAASDAKPKRA